MNENLSFQARIHILKNLVLFKNLKFCNTFFYKNRKFPIKVSKTFFIQTLVVGLAATIGKINFNRMKGRKIVSKNYFLNRFFKLEK